MTKTKEVAKVQKTNSERFTIMVMKEFSANLGKLEFNQKQKKLAQHLFLKCDEQLKFLEAKRVKSNSKMSPYTWDNVNAQKLALNAVHRIELGLDALIPNHISPIPYWNSKENKYDLDLRIGYAGKDYYRRKVATVEPRDIIYRLVYSTDHFKPIVKSFKNKVESYEFDIKEPFNRGDIIGGFGYIMFDDDELNKLVLVTEEDFQKSKHSAKTSDFWEKWPVEMRLKTLVHRVTDKLQVDPDKANESYFKVEADDLSNPVDDEINQNANAEEIDFPEAEVIGANKPEPEETELEQDFDEDGNPIPAGVGIPVDDMVDEQGPGF